MAISLFSPNYVPETLPNHTGPASVTAIVFAFGS